MKYVKVGKTDIEVSVLCFGSWGLGGGTSWADTDDERSIALVREAIDSGITLVDTAPVYGTGHSEEVLGRALADGYRDKCILSTKCTMQWHDPVDVKMYSRDAVTGHFSTVIEIYSTHCVVLSIAEYKKKVKEYDLYK